MKVTYLGQAGLLFEKCGFKIMIDPYLSDSVEKINPKNYRRVPVDESFFKIKPDVMIFTHNHLDHYDPETVTHFIDENSNITVLAPKGFYLCLLVLATSKRVYLQYNPVRYSLLFAVRVALVII